MTAVAAPAGIKAQVMEITPKLAEKLLARNTHNRGISTSRIGQYAADIRKGDWQLNGEAIKIAQTGQILDGQHRLLAILEADRPMTSLLITGLPAETQETMDQGRARSFGDVLKLRGEENYYSLAAAVRMVCLYERDGIPFTAGRPAPTVQQLSRTLERNPEIRESVKLALRLQRPWIANSVVAAMHYLFSVAHEADANDFITRLATGEDLQVVDAIYVLRERLIKEHYAVASVHSQVKLAFIVRAWNAYRAGETLTRLVWNPGGSQPDRFPEIDGLAAGRAVEGR